MRRFCFASLFASAHRRLTVWVASGIAVGCVAADRADSFYCYWMRAAVYGRVSIVGSSAAALFPLFISALAIAMQRDRLLSAVCFLRAVSLGFGAVLLYRCFRMRYGCAPFLLLFTAAASFVVLCRFVSYTSRDTLTARLRGALFAEALIVCADVFLISPWSARLM